MVFQIRQNTTASQNNFLNILVRFFVCLFVLFLIKMKNTSGNIKFPITSVSLGLTLFPFFKGVQYAFKENIVKNERYFFSMK